MGTHPDLRADVLVVGAGAAGLPAAIGAARAGAKVILIEEDPVVGGAPSDYFVCLFYGGPISGVLAELEALLNAKYSPVPRAQFYLPSGFQRAWRELLAAEERLHVITGARAARVLTSERGGRPVVRGVSVEVGPGASFDISAPVTIDATGSGAVSAMAGCEVMYGREGRGDFGEPSAPPQPDERVQACTWMYFVQRMPGADPLPPGERVGVPVNIGIPPRGHSGPWPPWDPGPDPGLYLQWGCAVFCRDPRDPVELARAHEEAYAAMERDHARLRESGHMIYLAPRIGVREASRIVGEYVLTEQDLRAGAFPEDTIAAADYGLDIWREEGAEAEAWEGHGGRGAVEVYDLEVARYGIPYRALVPRGVDGLLVAGKCMSGTHIAQSSFRVMPIVAAAGQAAGVAAALCAQRGAQPRALDPQEVRRLLRGERQRVQLSFDE